MYKPPIKTKKSMNKLYLSLGSNIENRLYFIKQATKLINNKVGFVFEKSNIYETPAWGFESTKFLNTCICVHTKFTTKESLIEFQKIEKELGRKAKTSTGYQARPIDIDIIYASEGIFNTPSLVVPHPLMQDRKFVLVPLLDILPKYIHPLLHKNTKELLTECNDGSQIINYN